MTETGSVCTSEKRNDSDLNSAVNVDAVEAKIALLLDFTYNANLCLVLHFALIWRWTPHPWRMNWLFQLSPFLSLPFSRFECYHWLFSGINDAASGERPRLLRMWASQDRGWVTMLATVSAFSVSWSVDANVRHYSVFRMLLRM
jgi:hypothetical protein